ncbi:extracellular serine-rich protein [Ophiocordyceps camponoti-floridani]|uniref:Extracellular serine-rich protein n=1 Tax=Ophiocordyceps camponoti-floridani TaxID=2030778 RepID=A0A8H4Q3X6_9HYPO|nr:extracellular serine-rich protein [Ophiocordyceps camponoti-floridani]
MHYSSFVVAALVGAAQANLFARQETTAGGGDEKVHVVHVGMNPQTNQTSKKYYPDKIEAQPGEVVQFIFDAPGSMHTVTQSTFDTPCEAMSGGVNSGMVPVKAGSSQKMVWNLKINDTKTVWAYCATGDHCKSKMVMVINEGTAIKANSSRTLDEYANKASQFNGKATGGEAGGKTGTGNAGSGRPNSSSATSNVVAVPVTVMLCLGIAFMLL